MHDRLLVGFQLPGAAVADARFQGADAVDERLTRLKRLVASPPYRLTEVITLIVELQNVHHLTQDKIAREIRSEGIQKSSVWVRYYSKLHKLPEPVFRLLDHGLPVAVAQQFRQLLTATEPEARGPAEAFVSELARIDDETAICRIREYVVTHHVERPGRKCSRESTEIPGTIQADADRVSQLLDLLCTASQKLAFSDVPDVSVEEAAALNRLVGKIADAAERLVAVRRLAVKASNRVTRK